MIKLYKLLILTALVITSNAYSLDFSNVKAIKLFDNSVINAQRDIKFIQFSEINDNEIDFLELRDNSIIDSTDISKFYFKKSKSIITPMMRFRAVHGDGSGG